MHKLSVRSTLSFVRVILIHLVVIIYSDLYNLCQTDVTNTHREGEPEKAPKSNWGLGQIHRIFVYSGTGPNLPGI